METTQGKAVAAYGTLAQLGRKTMPSFAAYKLFRLKKALAPVLEFQTEQEEKLVDELGGKITETGVILFAEKEKQAEYARKHRELETLKCEVDTERIQMTMKELPELSVADMETLDDFVTWKE
jgi:hypothetical protein